MATKSVKNLQEPRNTTFILSTEAVSTYLRSRSLSFTGSYLKALSFLAVVDNALVAVQGAPPDCKVSFNSLKTHPGELADPAMVDSEEIRQRL